jgi:hypothetical protein
MWDWLCDMAPTMRTRYPKIFAGTRGKHLFRLVRLCLLAVSRSIAPRSTLMQYEQEELVPEYCSYFEGKAFDELDVARSELSIRYA